MFRQVFDPENLFWHMVSRGVDFVGLGLFWAALCLPVVTIGPATAALYYTVVKTFRQGEDGAFGVYWRAFVDNLGSGCLATLLCLPIGVLLAGGYGVMAAHISDGTAGTVLFSAYRVALVVPLGVACYLFPLMARFRFRLRELFPTAFGLTVRHLPSTVVLVLLNLQLVIFTLDRWWPIFFTPVLASLLSSLFLERIFPKYLSPEETARLQNKPSEDGEGAE